MCSALGGPWWAPLLWCLCESGPVAGTQRADYRGQRGPGPSVLFIDDLLCAGGCTEQSGVDPAPTACSLSPAPARCSPSSSLLKPCGEWPVHWREGHVGAQPCGKCRTDVLPGVALTAGGGGYRGLGCIGQDIPPKVKFKLQRWVGGPQNDKAEEGSRLGGRDAGVRHRGRNPWRLLE